MTDVAAIQSVRLPTVSYAPFRLMEAMPWLMLAAATRVLTVKGGLVWLFAAVCSDIAIFLAFLLAARRMIELSDGKTGLYRLSFAQQLTLARKVMVPIILMMLVVSTIVFSLAARRTGLNLLLGFGGIAFDQWTPSGMVWSAFLAAVSLLLLLKAESTGKANLFDALRELWDRSVCMVPAIIAVSFADIGLSVCQGMVRSVCMPSSKALPRHRLSGHSSFSSSFSPLRRFESGQPSQFLCLHCASHTGVASPPPDPRRRIPTGLSIRIQKNVT